jgi:hypothetical protein
MQYKYQARPMGLCRASYGKGKIAMKLSTVTPAQNDIRKIAFAIGRSHAIAITALQSLKPANEAAEKVMKLHYITGLIASKIGAGKYSAKLAQEAAEILATPLPKLEKADPAKAKIRLACAKMATRHFNEAFHADKAKPSANRKPKTPVHKAPDATPIATPEQMGVTTGKASVVKINPAQTAPDALSRFDHMIANAMAFIDAHPKTKPFEPIHGFKLALAELQADIAKLRKEK